MKKISRYVFALMATLSVLACSKQEPDYSQWYEDDDTEDPSAPGDVTDWDLSIMSFNVRNYKNDANTEHSWENRCAGVYAMIKTEAPMVIGLQECYLTQRNDIMRNCPGYEAYGLGRDDGNQEGETTSVLFNTSILETVAYGTFWLSEKPEQPGPGWDARLPRTATWVKFRMKDGGKEFLFVNTHLDHEGQTAKVEGVKQIQSKIKELNTTGLPVILTGDFNSTSSDPIFDGLTLENVRETAPVKDNFGTSNGYGSGQSAQIDHIYYDSLVPLGYETIRDRWEGIVYISDHYPIMARFNFEK